ncbi:D-lyxose/D-mannose family sugar isomerase [Mammaliicoccus vitulinus]|uniref:D-lyxose ketol-isomerase n=1 Tax=Mammaliicoccus vitulinus TaxID=71237 RepID=A0A2T4PR35_9STAP|nr:D-lyxose/D-mannose family sugar isomerase [Mammaliicoccus vitulinus]PTI28473.1 D-lyxose/D-mannose family sugar isomerase [Mammaliicoccus vitulinus]PTI69793.1 D-lyxose/D-mannose family sugar isomerase [Mammaliicoccus vitulinus]RIN24994.1 D-lyxose/D-mannose family sugar isomerase [Mammaliicoccus vitulinus]
MSDNYKGKVKKYFEDSNIIFTDEEIENIEYADFGLNNIEVEGLNLIVYINENGYCAKEMALLPYQTCPEHMHPDSHDDLGKVETFRCRKGEVYLYIEGERNVSDIAEKIPNGKASYYTVFHEVKLLPGEQYTIPSNTKHWFQTSSRGAIISEFSTTSIDELDIFTDINVIR